MTVTNTDPIHATSVSIGGHGVLLIGDSGCGKSDLALRLIDRGATLVSDDYTSLQLREGRLFASPPPSIASRIEVRNLGIVDMPHVHNVPVALAIRLDDKPERMPTAETLSLMDVSVPLIRLAGLEASAPIKAELALRMLLEAQA